MNAKQFAPHSYLHLRHYQQTLASFQIASNQFTPTFNMSSSIILSQAFVPVNSHESLNLQNDRKRRHVSLNEQNNHKRHCSETLADKKVISMLATITSLEHQVSSLKKLLHQAYAPLHTTSTKHNCPALSCRKSFTNLEHLYRHIRDQDDSTHEPLTVLINEMHCSVCSKTCNRPLDLVRHEKSIHGETYVSRLDKFLGTSVSMSPPSSDSMTVHDSSR